MQFSLQMCSLIVMALASASAALPATTPHPTPSANPNAPRPTPSAHHTTPLPTPSANPNANWEFKGYEQTGHHGKELSLTGSGSDCRDFDHGVYSYTWNSGKFHSGKKEYGCSFTLYKGKKCTEGELYKGPNNGPLDSKKGDFSNDQHKAASIKIVCQHP